MATEIIQIDTTDFNLQSYQSTDVNLIPTFEVNTSLSDASNIEFFIYDNNKNILHTEYNFKNYSVLNNGQSADTNTLSQITFNPADDLSNLGFDQGEFIAYYSFLNKQIGSSIEPLYIAELSSDRTEIRLDSTLLTNADIVEKTTTFINERESSSYFLDFHLNFGDNQYVIANNIALDNEDPNNPTILIKLYEPLPDSYILNSTLWVNTIIEEPVAYKVTFEDEPIIFSDTVSVKGPNFNLDLKDQVNNSTTELSYIDIISTSLSSSHNQINSLLESKEIDINIDYNDFSKFIHFSSAQTRLENFYAKISLIEQYSASISVLDSTTSSQTEISSSKATYAGKIDNIITNFDGYDYFLYYTSGSHAWPKTTSTLPYELAKVNSVTVSDWFGSTNEYSSVYGGEILSASLYDNTNPDNLYYSIPEYLREDPSNQQYELFVNMVGQHYDNIWIYYNEVTQKYNSDNRLEYGVSKDLVADAIKDFGIKLYQNNFTNDDLFTSFLGLTPNGSIFPFPNITGSLPTPSGFEYVNTLISASNDNTALDDVNKSLYKRIYHNLPYLLKSKGTLPGLRALITSYGIPDTILRINEYGGKDRVNTNDWDYWQNEFNYAFSTSGSNFISSSWDLNSQWNAEDNVPSTLMFRFKTDGLPHDHIPYSQSIWYGDGGSALTLTYTGSAYNSASYNGSIIDPYYQYATLTLYPDVHNNTATASVYLPFFDGEWWSVMVNRSGSQFDLHAQNKLLGGGNNTDTIGFTGTSSINTTEYEWVNTNISYFPASFSTTGPSGYDVIVYDVGIYDGTGSLAATYSPFTGSYQEIRYYSDVVSNEAFANYTMNPYSIEGNTINESPNTLAFRAPVGGELYMLTSSIHPKVAGGWVTTHSFESHSNFFFDATPHFVPNTEYFYFNQPVIGIKNAISDKIRVENNVLPSGDTLSPFTNLLQQSHASSSYTPNINYLEVAFSPQNELNDDITSQLGNFNIGEYIGDPSLRLTPKQTYPALDTLRNEYFAKYTSKYKLSDFIRLIKFFDNSLFKMIRDFVPARTSLASGIVIKQHLLERNKYPQPQLSYQSLEISGSVKPQWNGYKEGTLTTTDGGTGGSINQSTLHSQSFGEVIQTLSGSVIKMHTTQDEFYNGELSGSAMIVTTQSLSDPSTDGSPLLNNVYDITPNLRYTEVDYSTNSTNPVNFDLIVANSSSKSNDDWDLTSPSYFPSQAYKIPRYVGSKSSSHKINQWTAGDKGTIGKTPTVESLKTSVAYCDSITGLSPEHENASKVHIKYLINADGTVSVPNSTPNSLQNNQGTFISGENVFISSRNEGINLDTSIGSNNNKSYREIIRGASRIEPILYNQSGSNPPQWSGSIEIQNMILPAVGNYTFSNIIGGTTEYPYTNEPTDATTTWHTFDNISDKNRIKITQQMADDGITLTLAGEIEFGGYLYSDSNANTSLKITLFRNDQEFTFPRFEFEFDHDVSFENKHIPYTFTLTPEIIKQNVGKTFIVASSARNAEKPFLIPNWRDPTWFMVTFSLAVSQYPSPNAQPTIKIEPSQIWVSSSFDYPSMHTTQSFMVDAYKTNLNTPTWYMKDIANSGYDPILTEWGVKRGDVFRFEGDEKKTYVVDYVTTGSVSGADAVIVHLNNPLPSNLNINHYSLTRYVNDASQIIIEGFRPNNTSAPYIIKPEFVVPELDKDIDAFIVDLTQKGLL
jgi:hypothetical protein